MAVRSFPLDRPQRVLIVSTPDQNNGEWVFCTKEGAEELELLSSKPDVPPERIFSDLREVLMDDINLKWLQENGDQLELSVIEFMKENYPS